jgi:hypothetical protein
MDAHTRKGVDANYEVVEQSIPSNEFIIPKGRVEISWIDDFRFLDAASDVRMREA